MSDVYKIEKMDHLGRGIIKIDGKIAFVNNALIGDEISVRILENKKNYFICDVEKYYKKSIFRKECFCKYSSICGGCEIGTLNYNQQLKYKESVISDMVHKYLKEDIKINKILYAKDINYRNKITLHVKNGKIGLFKKESNDLVEIDECLLVNDGINELIKKLKEFVKNKDLEKVIIKNTNINETMLVFYGNVDEKEVLSTFDCESMFINKKCLKNEYIKDKIGKYSFVLSKESFFQVNRFTTKVLYDEILRFVKDKKYNTVLDLYCGTGTIGIYVSDYVESVIGIEKVKDAVLSAEINRNLNNVNNIKFICDKVENIVDKYNNIDLIITDPPRSGMDKKTIANILNIMPKSIIYVSCNPMTLIRDLNILKSNYNIIELTPVDMFPNTTHCESITVLERK